MSVSDELRELNEKLVRENHQLILRVKDQEQELARLRASMHAKSPTLSAKTEPPKPHTFQDTEVSQNKNLLSLQEYLRYGRQLILPGFGLPGML
jgi:hypothetical protein